MNIKLQTIQVANLSRSGSKVYYKIQTYNEVTKNVSMVEVPPTQREKNFTAKYSGSITPRLL